MEVDWFVDQPLTAAQSLAALGDMQPRAQPTTRAADKGNFDPHCASMGGRDWHAQRNLSEPRCRVDQWRTRGQR